MGSFGGELEASRKHGESFPEKAPTECSNKIIQVMTTHAADPTEIGRTILWTRNPRPRRTSTRDVPHYTPETTAKDQKGQEDKAS